MYLGACSRGKYNAGLVHNYLALGVEQRHPPTLEATEDIEPELMSFQTFRDKLKNGEMECVYEVACAYQALDYLKRL